jgi:2Fe-2S ferredoxin
MLPLSRIHNYLTPANIAAAVIFDNALYKSRTEETHQELAMAVVTFVSYDGDKREAPLEEGRSLMQVALDNAVPGIDGDCGGEAACGTCHVVVDPQWSEMVGLSGAEEEGMLAMTPERQPTSRLSCQMVASAAWDGLIVQVPEFQM